MRGYLKRISEETPSEKSIKMEEVQYECQNSIESQSFAATAQELIEEIERLKSNARDFEKKLKIEEEFKINSSIKSKEKVDGLLADFLVILRDKNKVIQALKEKVDMKDQETLTENLEISRDAPKSKRNKPRNDSASSKPKLEVPKSKKKAEPVNSMPKVSDPKTKQNKPTNKENFFNPGQMPRRYKTRKGQK